MNSRKRKWRLRFSIATLLFVTLCVCGWLAGYQNGYRTGDGVWNYEGTTALAYNVSDLVTPIPNSKGFPQPVADFKPLLDVVRGVIEPGQTPTPEIIIFHQNLSIVVTGNGVIHRRISSLLSELRKQSEHAQAYNLYQGELWQRNVAKISAVD